MSNEEIIQKFWKGDVDINVEINKRLFSSICRKFNLNKEDAEDVIQQTLWELYKKRDKLTIEGNFYAYVYRACRNKAIDFVNRKKRNMQMVNEFTDSQQLSANQFENEEIRTVEEERLLIVTKEFMRLSEKCRSLLHMHIIDDLPYKEIVAIIAQDFKEHIEENTARQRAHNCRERLKKAIKKHLKN